MEEQQLNTLAITHLLQHTLRSLCIHENTHWVYAVFWRILPRNFPPPKWEFQGVACDRVRGNRRNWILGWEDGFCNFAASAIEHVGGTSSSPAAKGIQPDLFFKMSHEIYNYGEGLIGKVAADQGHRWVYSEPREHEINLLTAWNSPADYVCMWIIAVSIFFLLVVKFFQCFKAFIIKTLSFHLVHCSLSKLPRTWEAQFQTGIKTIALIAVKEGVIQLGSVNKVMEDLSFVVFLREKFAYLESIPGVLLPHASPPGIPIRIDGCGPQLPDNWMPVPEKAVSPAAPAFELYDHFSHRMKIVPTMNSLEALLSKLPAVGPSPPGSYELPAFVGTTGQRAGTDEGEAKEEVKEYGAGESSRVMPYSYYPNVSKSGKEF